MAGLDIKISGIEQIVKKLDAKNLNENINKVLNKFGIRVEKDAKGLAPVNKQKGQGNRLRSAIFFIPATDLSITVGCAANYAAYVEFGTGPFAAEYVPKLPKEWKEYAAQFFVNGQGHTPAQPFMYPAINKNTPRLIEDLKTVLND